ncbi:hypothetical protein Y032_0242g3426 [Ancylostoma ceylanicum]|uniref:Uncharacterized protein n=1 Tax=Ancylostoma ceylanicum TaxID=53326 RepID=A0A016SDL9_9BILA|nr:hypothetical protein Y032_0242g3426 [Ancylostoma ceylanicum]
MLVFCTYIFGAAHKFWLIFVTLLLSPKFFVFWRFQHNRNTCSNRTLPTSIVSSGAVDSISPLKVRATPCKPFFDLNVCPRPQYGVVDTVTKPPLLFDTFTKPSLPPGRAVLGPDGSAPQNSF